ncbi:hypothetical protein BJF92_19955 [Rhizobium rhizosphaerae]|uniref:Type II toxin-antitoxin system ParD family antitoxin n=1 Tax=Xaviernesmea rhizosphaerae TaxID=1672749 RepID=A0A1Q9ALC7_9HYPH|nr:type II toxin-antitoxin system ParD family antitoxin [Xaviernesmea rhizosphaerae]OLP56086.1 hypothetical protein BJF92_19955 [Xaviernesmea rhizosphaerae]OQP86883.1 hypothetical protein BTR14_08060 [Xaviernesmea rhizosphaerae]
MPSTVTVTLDDDLLALAQELVDRGWFGSVEEVLLGGLRRLEREAEELCALHDTLMEEGEEDEDEALDAMMAPAPRRQRDAV